MKRKLMSNLFIEAVKDSKSKDNALKPDGKVYVAKKPKSK